MDSELILKKIIQAQEKQETERLNDSLNFFAQVFIDSVKDNSVVSFYNNTKKLTDKFEAISNVMGISGDVEKEKIYYFSMMKTIVNIAEHLSDLEVKRTPEDFSGYKYVYSILEILYHNGATPQGNISNCLKIDSHNLANSMRRTNKYCLWTTRKHGREVYYQITNKGERVYDEHIREKYTAKETSLEKFINITIDSIKKEFVEWKPDVNKVIRSVNSEMGCVVLKSKYSKIKLQELFFARDEFAKKFYPKALVNQSKYSDNLNSKPNTNKLISGFTSEDTRDEIIYDIYYDMDL